jgi:hypothetical protein
MKRANFMNTPFDFMNTPYLYMNAAFLKTSVVCFYDLKCRHAARGIVAEPPKRGGTTREGDGADSPTRACEAREAARPISN